MTSPDGLRTSKKVNGVRTYYIWSGGNIVAEITGDKIVTYLYGLNRISRKISGPGYSGTYVERDPVTKTDVEISIDFYHECYVYDGHGNVVQLYNAGIDKYLTKTQWEKDNPSPEFDTNGDGCVDVMDLSKFLNTYPLTQSYYYDAFGNHLGEEKSYDSNTFRYCGEYWDKETGEVYLRARYYNPKIGRFTARDTHWNTGNMIYGDEKVKNTNYDEDKEYYIPDINAVKQSGNLYVYCMGNPQYYVDPIGFKVYIVGGAVAADCGASVSGNLALVFDDNGNVGTMEVVGAGGGIFGASACAIIGIFPEMNTVDQLEGLGGFVTVTAGEGVVATGSLNFSEGNEGIIVGGGFGVGSPIDFSGGASFSKVKTTVENNKILTEILKVAVFGWAGVFM